MATGGASELGVNAAGFFFCGGELVCQKMYKGRMCWLVYPSKQRIQNTSHVHMKNSCLGVVRHLVSPSQPDVYMICLQRSAPATKRDASPKPVVQAGRLETPRKS